MLIKFSKFYLVKFLFILLSVPYSVILPSISNENLDNDLTYVHKLLDDFEISNDYSNIKKFDSTLTSEYRKKLVFNCTENNSSYISNLVGNDFNLDVRPAPLNIMRLSDVSRALDISTTGRLALVGLDDSNIKLLDITDISNPIALSTFKSSSAVTSVSISPDCSFVLVGSNNSNIALWSIEDTANPKMLCELEGHKGSVNSVKFSCDGNFALTGAGDNKVILWNLINKNSPARLCVLSAHTDPISSVSFSSDDRYALTSSEDRTAILWDLKDKDNPVQDCIIKNDKAIKSASLGADKQVLLSSAGLSSLWDLTKTSSSNALVRCKLTGHSAQVNSVILSPDNRYAMTASRDGDIKLWNLSDANNPNNYNTIQTNTKGVTYISMSLTSKSLLSATEDFNLQFWKLFNANLKSVYNLNLPQLFLLIKISKLSQYNNELGITTENREIFETLPSDLQSFINTHIKKISVVSPHSIKALSNVSLSNKSSSPVISSGSSSSPVSSISPLLPSATSPNSKGLQYIHDSIDSMLRDNTFKVAKEIDLWFSDEKATLKKQLLSRFNKLFGDINKIKSKPVYLKDDSSAGHKASINSIVCSADFKYVLTGSSDCTAKLWNIEDLNFISVTKSFIGHTSSITAVALSADKQTILTGSLDREYNFWNSGNAARRSLNKLTNSVTSLAINPDNTMALAGCMDGTAKLFSTGVQKQLGAAGKELAVLAGHNKALNCLAFSPDISKKFIITGSSDTTARIWDCTSGLKFLCSMTGQSNSVKSLAISSDCKFTLLGCSDNTAYLWNIENLSEPRRFATLKGHTGPINSVAFSPDTQYTFTGSSDGTIKVWNIINPRDPVLEKSLSSGNCPINSIAFTGKYILGGASDGTVRMWPFGDASILDRLSISQLNFIIKTLSLNTYNSELENQNYREIFASLDSSLAEYIQKHVNSLPASGVINCFDPNNIENVKSLDAKLSEEEKKALIAQVMLKYKSKFPKVLGDNNTPGVLGGHESSVNAVALSSDSTLAITASSDRTAKLWSIESQTEPAEMGVLNANDGALTSVAMSSDPDNRLILLGSEDGCVRSCYVSDPTNFSEIYRSDSSDKSDKAIVSLDISLDSQRYLVASGNRAVVSNFDNSGEEISLVHDKISCAAFSPDGTLVITGSNTNTGRIWDITYSPVKRLCELVFHTSPIRSAAISNNKKLALTGSRDNNAILYDLTKRTADKIDAKRLSDLKHVGSINSVGFTSDDSCAITASSDYKVNFWSTKDNYSIVKTLETGHTNSIKSMAISSKYILTGSTDCTGRLFTLSEGGRLLTGLNLQQLAFLIRLSNLENNDGIIQNSPEYTVIIKTLSPELRAAIKEYMSRLPRLDA